MQNSLQDAVSALRDQVRDVAAGRDFRPLSLEDTDELGGLAREVSEMCQEVQTARRNIAAEAAAREDALQQLHHLERLAALGKLASIVAHELGTPLNVIAARATMILAGEVEGPMLTDSARIIVEQSERMSRIIKEVLGKVRKGRPVRSPIEISALIHEAVSLMSRLADRHQVRIEFARDQAGELEVDGSRILQALTNLIANGIQAMSPGGTMQIEARKLGAEPDEHRAPNGYWCLRVRDDGVGISAEHLNVIFKPFFTTRHESMGTGLGLAVAEGIAQEHGGWIEVESELTRGSCFTICLPIGV